MLQADRCGKHIRLACLVCLQHRKILKDIPSSVCRIFERRGAGNLENLKTTKTKIKNFPPVRFPAQNQVKNKKKKSYSLRFSPVFGPKLGEGQKKVFAHRLCAQTYCPSYKGGAMPQFFTFYSMLIVLSWRSKGGRRVMA